MNQVAPLPPLPVRSFRHINVLGWVCVQCGHEEQAVSHIMAHCQVTGHRELSLRCEEGT